MDPQHIQNMFNNILQLLSELPTNVTSGIADYKTRLTTLQKQLHKL